MKTYEYTIANAFFNGRKDEAVEYLKLLHKLPAHLLSPVDALLEWASEEFTKDDFVQFVHYRKKYFDSTGYALTLPTGADDIIKLMGTPTEDTLFGNRSYWRLQQIQPNNGICMPSALYPLKWWPQDDITLHELALAIPYANMGNQYLHAALENPIIGKHFKWDIKSDKYLKQSIRESNPNPPHKD